MKRRAPRSPFVVTVALAVVACGGTTVSGNTDGGAGAGASGGSGGSTGGSGGSSGGTGGSGGTAGVGACPADGTPCDGTTTWCQDPNSACTGHQCICGTWQTRVGGTGCNPPPPMCPDTMPVNGAPCTDEGLQCSFPTDPNNCCPPAQAMCTCGVWQTAISTCNPPAPPCPVDPPQQGASCATSDPCAVKMYSCSWPCAAGNCDGAQWTVTPTCAPADAGSD